MYNKLLHNPEFLLVSKIPLPRTLFVDLRKATSYIDAYDCSLFTSSRRCVLRHFESLPQF